MFRRSRSKLSYNPNKPTRQRSRSHNSHVRNRTGSKISPSRYVNKALAKNAAEQVAIQHSFTDFPIADVLKRNIQTRGYQTPTPIQDQTIPLILEGKDVVGIANTGTGKTAAFLVPLIDKIIRIRSERVLVLVPTRELAVQINTELIHFSRNLQIHSVLVMGGASINRQISEFNRKPHFIIATPGRLKDLVIHHHLSLADFKNIVLDEVDRMVDIGFIRDIKYLISQLPKQRQSLFFSATVPDEVQTIIQEFLHDPVTVSVKVKEMPQAIDQDVIRVQKHEKIDTLKSILRKQEFTKVLIFGRTKWGVEKLSNILQQNGFLADSIHGNKSQGQRLRALNQFRSNKLQVLVATDVVARGVDITDVSHVINYDEPASYTDYIHRIGRTGRANKQGKALTFVE